jgi:hypothetical protein
VDRAPRKEPLTPSPGTRRSVLAAGVLFLAAGVALGAPVPAGNARPGAGTVLRPGQVRFVDIGVPPPGADEWEAFLSVDGGRTFPVRITPHLPVAESSFAWTVPALPTPAARIRLRFGVAGVERERVSPDRFAIGLAPGAAPVLGTGASPGNAPAPGEEDTLVWVERRGGRTFLAAAGAARGMAPESRWNAGIRAWLAIPRQRCAEAPSAAAARRSKFSCPRHSPSRASPPRRSLASLSRLNI